MKLKKSLDSSTVAQSRFKNKNFNIHRDPYYQEMREKFGRTIDSKFYQRYKKLDEEATPVNVLKVNEANKLVEELV